MEVVITGASGYIGQHLTAELIKRGVKVRAVVRPRAHADDLAVLKKLGADIYEGELVNAANNSEKDLQIEKAFAGADRAVHLIGSVAPPKDGPGVEELHRSYTDSFARSCAEAGIKHSVLLTALGADEKSESLYLSSKKHAETAFGQCLQAAGLKATVVRPSLIVGRLLGHRDSKLVDRYRMLLNTRPMVPLIGGGKNMLEPVFIGDLAAALATILEKDNLTPADQTEIIEIGGPQKLSMKQFVEAFASSLSISKPTMDVPFGVAAMAAGIFKQTQDVPLLSADQVKLAGIDMVTSVNALPSLLAPASPTALSVALASYQTRA